MTFTSLREILNYYLWWHQGFILILLEKIIWDPFLALLSTFWVPWVPNTEVKNARYLLGGREEITSFLAFFSSPEKFWNKNFLFVASSWCHAFSRSVGWANGVTSLPAQRGAARLLVPEMNPQAWVAPRCGGSIPAFSITLPAAREVDWGQTLPHAAETCFACSDFPFFSSC